MQQHSHPIRGYFYIAAAGLLWAASAALGRAVFTGRLIAGTSISNLDPLILSQARTTLSVIALLPLLLVVRGRTAVSLPRRDLVQCMVLGLGLVGSNYFYYLAIERTTVATAIILQYTAPVWVLLYMVARKLQRPSLQRVFAVAAAVSGSALAIGIGGGSRLRLDLLGVLAAQGAALSFAFYNVYGHHLIVRYERWKVFFYALLGASAFWIVANPPWAVLQARYSPEQWAFLGVFAFTSMLIPYAFYFAGLQHLDATRAVVTSCLEPVFATALAAIFLGEIVTALQTLGMGIVLGATILVQVPGREPEDVLPPPTEETHGT